MAGVPVDKQLEGKGCASERCQITTHSGTHLDAPWHYHPTMNGGERAWTIDEVPLEWCFGRGVKLDFRDKPDGYVCSAADVEAELDVSAIPFSRSTSCSSTPRPAPAMVTTISSGGVAASDARSSSSDRARRQGHRHRWLELGCALLLHGQAHQGDGRLFTILGRPQGRRGARLLSHREALQPRSAAADRLHGVLFSREDRRRLAGWCRAVAIFQD